MHCICIYSFEKNCWTSYFGTLIYYHRNMVIVVIVISDYSSSKLGLIIG